MSRERLTAHGFCSWPFRFLILLAFSFAEAAGVHIESIKIEGADRVVINSKGAPSMTNHVLAGPSITTVTQIVASGQADASGLAKFSLPISESLMFFRVQQDNSQSNVTLIEYGQSIDEKLVFAGEVRTYQFSAQAGDTVTIGGASRDFRIQMQLLDAEGVPVTNLVSAQYFRSPARINAVLLTSGIYFISLNDADNARTGSFALQIDRANRPVNSVSLRYGQSLADSLDEVGQMKIYSFDGRQGDLIRVRIVFEVQSPLLEFVDGDGAWIKSAVRGSELAVGDAHFVGFAAQVVGFDAQLLKDGPNSLIFSDQLGSTGKYFVYLDRLNGPGFPTSITFGQTIKTNLNIVGETDAYHFEGGRGDLIRIVMNREGTLNNSRFVPNLELFDGLGGSLEPMQYLNDYPVEIFSIGRVQSLFQVALPRSGAYYIFSRNSQIHYTGEYSISLDRLYSPDAPPTISSGQTLESNISFAGQAPAYTFQAQTGEVISVTAGDGIGNGYYDADSMVAQLRLMDETGVIVPPKFQAVAEIAEFSQVYFVEKAGRYVAAVWDQSNYRTGSFRINVNGSSTAVPIGYGESVGGEISTLGQVNAYRFQGQTGQVTRITAKLGPTTNAMQVRLLLVDAQAKKVKIGVMPNSASQISMDVELGEAGAYFLFISDSGQNATGPYSLSLEQIDRFATSKVIAYGQTLTDTVTAFGEMRGFRFQGEAGDRIQMASTGLSTNAHGWRPGLRVSDEQGRFLQTGVDGNATLPMSGTYHLWAQNFSESVTGDFALSLDRLNGPANPILISYGQTTEGILKPSQAQSYQFEGKSGDWVRIIMTDGNEEPASVDSALEITDAYGSYPILGHSMGGPYRLNMAKVMEVTLTNTGPYFIFASDRLRHNSGRYFLSLYKLNSVEDAIPVSYGETVTGTIDKPGRAIAYRLEPRAGDLVRIVMRKAPGSNTTLNPNLELRLISDRLLWRDFAPAADGQSATLEAEIVNDGSYLLLAEDADQANTGAYGLSVSRITPPDQPRRIEYGEIVEGLITSELPARTYNFQGKAGDLVYIALASDDERPRNIEFEVRDNAGTLVANGSVANHEIPTTIAESYPELRTSGAFAIVVKGARKFWLGLALNRQPGRATPIVFGQTMKDSVRAPIHFRSYSFDAQQGEIVRIVTGGTIGDFGWLGPGYAYFGEGGRVPVTFASAFPPYNPNSWTPTLSTVFTIDRNDRYYISMAGGIGQFVNWIPMTYSIHLEKLNRQATSYGQIVEGNLTTEIPIALYTFDGAAGDRVRVSLNSSFGPPHLQVRPLDQSSGAWADGDRQVTLTLSTTGTYCILVSDAGAYSIMLEKLGESP
jgi:hypothetical protein